MKIALVCTEKLPVPSIAGGAIQLYIDGILPYLSQQHKITVFSIEYPGLPTEEVREGVKYIRVPGGKSAPYLNNLKSKITGEFDLIHIFNRPSWVNPLSQNLPDTRFSLSLHNEMFHPEKISPGEAAKCIDRVEFINTVSKFIADGIAALYPQAGPKLRPVYSGADIEKYHPAWTEEGMKNKSSLKEKFGLQDHRVVLFVGRLSVKKGVHTLLRAMKGVMEVSPDVAIVVIGSKWFGGNKSDDYVQSLKSLAESLPGPIVFTGFLPPSDIPAHYNIADVFVCPSQWNEPLARVHYEAMAAGLPIITTNRGGNAEVVASYGNGIVIDDYKNPQAFANYIRHFLDNPSMALKAGKAGRQLAETKYNWKRVADEILERMGEFV